MHSLGSVIHFIFLGYSVMLFVRVLGSWFPHFQKFSLMRFVIFYTEPYLKVFRKVVPTIGMVDLSPLIAFLALGFLEKLILLFIH